ncbi:pyridoxamine 5'-phosphate oxidase family protein [Vibrio quintilis]|uniref:Pyridoxamine 5'-phosphate oxidase n=1 Tax=Vibrio quintilis TaxID=1117707 RepID=A0A1M7YXD2_9VIBR|nr:pyridoxamine 5'-phosphate oxidase family protein [Vibrio quintilis]SHO57291.1 Pyridoxamine 5'-phosphate oxidase [Vibrio quintilis]
MLSATPRTQINKGPHKAVQSQDALHRIIDESMVAHIGLIQEHGPVVIPMLAWRVDEHIYIHGANNSRLMRHFKQGNPACLTFTLFDGWVLARSAFHHGAHYRSAVVYGNFTAVDSEAEKDRLLNHFIEQIAPGRTADIRLSDPKELAATMVLAMPLTEASVKISNKGVNDDESDLSHPVWAGVMPYRTVVGPLQPAPDLAPGIETPDYSAAYAKHWKDGCRDV